VNILSTVPQQEYTLEQKLKYIYLLPRADLTVLPQEYFGGMYIMSRHPCFEEEELRWPLEQIAKIKSTHLVVGVVEKERDQIFQRAWIIHREKGLIDKFTKCAIPSYADIERGGYYGITAGNLEDRARCVELDEWRVTLLFCWEAFSKSVWSALASGHPDLVLSLIKFGTMAEPLYGEKEGKRYLRGFEVREGQDSWVERLEQASRWEVECPIICATNTWDLDLRSHPFCGLVGFNLVSPTIKSSGGCVAWITLKKGKKVFPRDERQERIQYWEEKWTKQRLNKP